MNLSVCLVTISLTALAALMVVAAPGSAAEAPKPWPARKADAWYAKQPWLVGFNYVPSTAGNTTEFWQAETFDPATIDRELAWAESLGFNTCRVFIQYIVWKADPDGLESRLAQFLEIADRHGLTVMPVLFDDCAFGNPPLSEPALGRQRDIIPGMILSNWTPSPGLSAVTDRTRWPSLERYVKALVGRFGRDKRVVAWDLYNEPGNSGMGERSLPLVEAAFGWAREAKPSQPLTVAVWNADLKTMNERQMALSDVVSFHLYADVNAMRGAIERYKAAGRPVICTEWMARLLGSKWETDLPLFRKEGVGCYSWGLVNGRSQAQYPWWAKSGDPEPPAWFHDLLHRDGTPYRTAETSFIRATTDAPGVPKLRPFFDFPLRDTSVCFVDGVYYLTGTTGAPNWWDTNEGVRLWRSTDMKVWEPMGLVWSFEKDATWQKAVDGKRALWAPEIHHLRGTYWIAYCVNTGGTGLLKSTSGKPEGPYVDVKPDGPLTGEIDASLFQDDDGAVYFVFQNGKIARMKDDMTGLAGEPRLLKPANAAQVGFEGAFLFKANGRYYLSCADFNQGDYHCYVASSDRLMDGYGDRYLAVPHGGHNVFFRDASGAWWSTFFGNDTFAPFRERPGLLQVAFGLDGMPRPVITRQKSGS